MKDLMNFAIAKIRAKEATLLDNSDYIRLSQSRNSTEFLKLISEYGYDSNEDFNNSLSNELQNTYDYIKDATKNGNLIYPFLLKYDLFNMVVYLKAELSRKDFKIENLPFINCGNYPVEELVISLRDKKNSFPKELVECFYKAKEIFLETGDISISQIHLEKSGYEYILSCIKKTDSEFIKKYYTASVDIKNFLFSLRLKKINSEKLIKNVLIDGGNIEKDKIMKAFFSSLSDLGEVFKKSLDSKTVEDAIRAFTQNKLFSEISEILDVNLQNLIDKTRLTAFGIDPIVSYMLNKEKEVSKLRHLYYNILLKKQ